MPQYLIELRVDMPDGIDPTTWMAAVIDRSTPPGASHPYRPTILRYRKMEPLWAPPQDGRRVIDVFTGPHRFLSNFHPCPVMVGTTTFPSSEHAFQAAKSKDPKRDWPRFADPEVSAAEAKRMGRNVALREDWEEKKIPVMRRIVYLKFAQNPDLGGLLLSTGDALLVEGNTWGDIFWGVCRGTGQNWLGRILMEVRDQLRKERP